MKNVGKLFEIERKHNLFSLRAEGKFPIWDILREHVDAHINGYLVKNIRPSFFERYNWIFFHNAIRSFFNLFRKSNKIMFHINSRNKNTRGTYYDRNVKQIMDILTSEEMTIIEAASFNSKLEEQQAQMVNERLPAVLWMLFIPKIDSATKQQLRYITDIINAKFPDSILSYNSLLKVYITFKREYDIFTRVFRKGNTEKLFYVDCGNHKGMMLAAKENAVPIYEFQHGIIVSDHVSYSYNEHIEYNDGDVICPELLFTLGSYWDTQVRKPFTKVVTLGNDYFFVEEIDRIGCGLLFISSIVHEEDLSSLAKAIADRDKELTIYYKLHPNQFGEKQLVDKFFASHSNVKVISDEIDMPELFKRAKTVISIASTVVYEALQAGLNAVLYKRMNYMFHEGLFSKKQVHLIDNVEDFFYLYDNSELDNLNSGESFFEPFNEEKARKYTGI